MHLVGALALEDAAPGCRGSYLVDLLLGHARFERVVGTTVVGMRV